MAKPFADRAGSGLHLHVSVNDAEGKNIFASEDPAGTPALRHAVGGLKATLADGMAIFAPNANSYRRFRANSYAPVAPTWGVNNRTVSLRVPAGPPGGRHIEHRVAGADANPYLALAALLAGVHHGLTRNRSIPARRWSATATRPRRRATCACPPTGSRRSTPSRPQPSCATIWAIGSVEMFAKVKRTEQDRFFAEVQPLDYDWYLKNA